MNNLPKHPGRAHLARQTTTTQNGQRLRANTLSGSLILDLQLIKEHLVVAFRVGRSGLRETTQSLIHEGLLQNEPLRGSFVKVLKVEDLFDLYMVRRALESVAVEQIISQRNQISTSCSFTTLQER